jgi:hypothetical protein
MMGRKPSPHNQALSDQIVAILRDANGFPLSTGEIAKQLGGRLVSYPHQPLPPLPRPKCWPADMVEPEPQSRFDPWCHQCGRNHREPVWRPYDAQLIRPLLNRLAKTNEVEKVVLDSTRNHYWRRDDSDAPIDHEAPADG